MITDQNTLRRELRTQFPRNHGQLLPALYTSSSTNSATCPAGQWKSWAGTWAYLPLKSMGPPPHTPSLESTDPGNTLVRVCTALSCLVSGSHDILAALENELESDADSPTEERQFTLEETPCGFLCGMAPAIEINGRWHGRLDPQSAIKLVRKSAND